MKLWITLLLFILIDKSASKTDRTREPKAKGKDVVDAVINQIYESKIFPDDHQLLRRVACHESKFGNDKDTFENKNGKPYYGGIWQIDKIGFEATQDNKSHPSLTKTYEKIKEIFNIDWNSLTWEDMLKPLYSGLAARIIFSTVPEKIPETLQEQATYWKTYYNTESGKGTVEKFIESVKSKECSIECRGKMDFCILLDGSGSIGSDNFIIAKNFVANLINTFSLDNVNVGLIVFDDKANVIFSLNNNLSDSEIKTKVVNLNYPGGGTYTDDAILLAVSMFQNTAHRDGVPRVMTVFTDGQSNNGVTKGVAEAKQNNISSFAVGIGSGINERELEQIAYGDSSHVFLRSSYKALGEFFEKMNSETCKVPQKPKIGTKFSDTLAQNEKRYFSYGLTRDGITISVTVTVGKTEAFYSYTVKTPSSALNDGIISGHTFIPLPKHSNRRKRAVDENEVQVFIAIEGIAENNNYTIQGEEGKKSFSSKMEPLPKFFVLSFLCSVLFNYFQ